MNNAKSPKNVSLKNQLVIGIFRKIFGDYPEDLETVMEQVYLHFLAQGSPDFQPLIWWKSREKTICL